MTTIEFFITATKGGYRLLDGEGEAHAPITFPTRDAAADAAIRVAQDLNALYSIDGL